MLIKTLMFCSFLKKSRIEKPIKKLVFLTNELAQSMINGDGMTTVSQEMGNGKPRWTGNRMEFSTRMYG